MSIDKVKKLFQIKENTVSEVFDLSEKVEEIDSYLTTVKEDLETVRVDLKESEAELREMIDNVETIKGDKGDTGSPGKDGRDGVDGIDGKDGKDGLNGQNGAQGERGKDADETEIAKKVLSEIKLPEIDNTEIEKLKNDIKEVEEKIEELKKRPVKGGGTSAMGIANAAKWFVKTEKPVGDINSVNRTYTLSKPIFAVLSMSLNGEFIARLPNYTINGKTITFSTAVPNDYATKDWEVVYI